LFVSFFLGNFTSNSNNSDFIPVRILLLEEPKDSGLHYFFLEYGSIPHTAFSASESKARFC